MRLTGAGEAADLGSDRFASQSFAAKGLSLLDDGLPRWSVETTRSRGPIFEPSHLRL
ncbi:hypothetical protein MES5069_520159 [Mesorhizobium escarrei]|uniref:Uncharacterized protein n=1 Tax=Mesorhizobium escarrei TaxID=666018 RepID=A0ABN8KCW7_9HYPH|nr:hypothetical protein MES5069_520159 [Mesorhizobium escarrei]